MKSRGTLKASSFHGESPDAHLTAAFSSEWKGRKAEWRRKCAETGPISPFYCDSELEMNPPDDASGT